MQNLEMILLTELRDKRRLEFKRIWDMAGKESIIKKLQNDKEIFVQRIFDTLFVMAATGLIILEKDKAKKLIAICVTRKGVELAERIIQRRVRFNKRKENETDIKNNT